MKTFLPATMVFAAFTVGCARSQPDMSQVGAGLSVIGLGIVIGCLVLALIRKGGGGNE